MTLDDDDLVELGFGNFWSASVESIRQGARSSVVASRFHADGRRAPQSSETKDKRTVSRRRNKDIRRKRNQRFRFDGRQL